jgi:hypothetical protein
MTELWKRSAQKLAALIASKQVSSVEVVDAHLSRIETVNPKVNAIVRIMADEARAGAAEADRKVASGDALGPLHGVPCTVKENIDMAGLPTTWGVASRCSRGGENAGRRCHTGWPHEPSRYGCPRRLCRSPSDSKYAAVRCVAWGDQPRHTRT